MRELLNYRDAFNLVSEYLDSGEPVTEGLIREIHKRLVEGVRGGAGRPRRRTARCRTTSSNSRTREVIYTPPPPDDVPPLMRELVAWLRAESAIHPVLVAGIAQFQLVHIHPFLDGNGRTSRLLSTLCLYRAGYDFKRLFTLSEYYDRDRERVLPGDSGRARAGHGPDRLAGVLRRRAGHPARRGQGAGRSGHARTSRPVRTAQRIDRPASGRGLGAGSSMEDLEERLPERESRTLRARSLGLDEQGAARQRWQRTGRSYSRTKGP